MGYIFLMFATVVFLIWLAGYVTGARRHDRNTDAPPAPWRW